MKKNYLYAHKIQTILRLLSLISIVLLVISNIKRFENYILKQPSRNVYEFVSFIINCIIVLLFTVIQFTPTKIGIFSIISMLYGVQILIFEPQNNMGILMYGLSIISLYARGMFNKHKKIKNIVVFTFFIVLVLSELRFGKEVFLSCVLEKIAFSFVFFLCLFFLQVYTYDVFETNESNSKLDLQKFPKLKKRDAEWLVEILNGVKYEALAIEYQMSLGSIKNRFKIIFKELGVGDKQGFFNKYSDYEICYGDDFSSSKNKKKFFNV